jgi:hypothetical protein
MTASAPLPQRTCRLCDTEVDGLYCSPECSAEAAELIEFQRIIIAMLPERPTWRIPT